MLNPYTLTIDGTDRTLCVVARSIIITDSSEAEPSTMEFKMTIRDGGSLPQGDDEVIVTMGSERLFAGRILSLSPQRPKVGIVTWEIKCVDYNRDLDRNLVVESYEDMTDREIISDIIDNYAPDFTITNVVEGISISQLVFNYVTPSQCFDEICELTGRTWYCDYNKDIHYLLPTANTAPFNISEV